MSKINQELANNLLSLIAPPPPQQPVVGKLTLAMLNNSHWDTRPDLVLKGLGIFICRVYKLFKYYDSTSHMYAKAGEIDNCKRVLVDLLLGTTLLDLDYRFWVRECGNPDFYAATNLSKLLLTIPKLYGVLDETSAIVEQYIEMDSNSNTWSYIDHMIREGLGVIDETDNLECPKMYPIRRYIAKNDIKLSSHDLNLKISQNSFDNTASSYMIMLEIQKFFSRKDFLDAMEQFSKLCNFDLTELYKIRDFKFTIDRAYQISTFFKGVMVD